MKAFEALVAVCEGKASNDRRLNEALCTLSLDTKDGGGAVYVNEYTNDGMTGYATTLLDAFQVKGIYRTKASPEEMVQRLLDGMKTERIAEMIMAKEHVERIHERIHGNIDPERTLWFDSCWIQRQRPK